MFMPLAISCYRVSWIKCNSISTWKYASWKNVDF